MDKDHYFKYPLALIRNSEDTLDYFRKAVLFAAVNAGIGFRKSHSENEFLMKLEEVITEECDEEAIIGASLCGINLIDESGHSARAAYDSIIAECGGIPTTNIRGDIFLAAYQTAQKEANKDLPEPDKWISWREFRVIAAIYSLQWNSRNFCEAGWETIRYRACGFHNKKLFQEFEDSDTPWPDHILPLSRDQIKRTIEKLEELKFFVRCRISSNPRHGGKFAYSIKYDSREDLMKDVLSKQAYSRGDHIRENRANDHLLYVKRQFEKEQSIIAKYEEAEKIQVEIEKLQSISKQRRESTAEAHKHSKPASHQQVGHQGGQQHNEKSRDEKFIDEKSNDEKCFNNNIPAEVASLGNEQIETGYCLEGRFLTSSDANILIIQNPDIWSQFKSAKRIRTSDGNERIELAA